MAVEELKKEELHEGVELQDRKQIENQKNNIN